jgi:hypothetical protein
MFTEASGRVCHHFLTLKTRCLSLSLVKLHNSFSHPTTPTFLPPPPLLRQTTLSTMALWVDKHRPNNLDKLDYHADLSVHLKKLVMTLPEPTNFIHPMTRRMKGEREKKASAIDTSFILHYSALREISLTC